MTYSTDEEQLTKKQRREEARARRKALEEAEQSQAARRRRLSLIGGVLAVLSIGAVVAVAAMSGGSASKKAVSGAGVAAGLQATPAPWAPEYTGLSTRLQALNLPTQNDGAYHVHAAVRLYVNGRQIPVPANIGIEPGGESMASLHTHDSSGVIHIEASEKYPFTLGQLFTIWGVKFTNTQLGSYVTGGGNVLAAYANGQAVPNPVGYVLNPHDDIVVAYGKPGSFPTGFQYNWTAAGI
jgi:hypothetical protein